MAQDRLAALRAQRQQQQQDGPPTNETYEAYQMSGMQSNTSANADILSGGMPAFYKEISSLQDAIAQFNKNVNQISDLHTRSLNAIDGSSGSADDAQRLDALSTETRQLSNGIKQRISALKSVPAANEKEAQVRHSQTKLVGTKFMDAIQHFQQVEQQYRQRSKQRVERQFKIVKPDATPEEIAAVVDDGNNQIFAQALTSSTRYSDSRAAYQEVQERHQDLVKLQQTLGELAQLFNDLAILVDQQQEVIDTIGKQAADVEDHTNSGNLDLERAVESARAARRKRWICFWIFVGILVVIAAVIGIYYGLNHTHIQTS